MKLLCIIFLLTLLTGCGVQSAWETVDDQWIEAAAPCKQLEIRLPKEATLPVLQSPDAGKLYLCDGYTLTMQTFDGGDLDDTMRQLTGFSEEQLTCVETRVGELKRYACVWSSAGEGGDHVGRAVILDDGSYHYAVCVMADYMSAGDLAKTWQEILNSVTLTDTD